MKKGLPLLAMGCVISSLMASTLAAPQPKLIQCQPTQGMANNVQCTYRVVGQQTYNPQSVSNLYAMTNMPYALCSKAVCQVQNSKARYANCTCSVFGTQSSSKKVFWKNISEGPKNFTDSKPAFSNKQLTQVTSNFSMANQSDSGKNQTTCTFSSKTAWANCFGVRCQVRYQMVNGQSTPMAYCRCPVAWTKTFVSIGPQGDTSKCKTPANRIWSAATVSQGSNNNYVISNMMQRFVGK